MGWLQRLFGGRPAADPGLAPQARPLAPPRDVAAPGAPVSPSPTAAPGPPLLCWLLDAPLAPSPPSAAECQALEAVERVLSLPALAPELLPRAANVVPQLLALLRQQDLPVPVLAERIGRDPVLAAEVLRQAGGAFFAHLGPVADLPQAIQRLGTEGLQMAIARVVLRPLYQAQPGSLPALAAPRLWAHADALSRLAAEAARAAGLSAFDGYLAGLLHDTGWTVMFHALQRSGVAGLGPLSADGVQAFEGQAHRLFGRAAEGWQITPAFTALAADAQRVPLAASPVALAAALRAVQGPCMAELLAA